MLEFNHALAIPQGSFKENHEELHNPKKFCRLHLGARLWPQGASLEASGTLCLGYINWRRHGRPVGCMVVIMSKHTPGPWVFGIRNYDEDCGFAEKPFDYVGPGYYDNPGIFGPGGMEVVGCDEYFIFNSPEDARLISAAPDLLEALQNMLAQYKTVHGIGDMEMQSAIDFAHKAISKATGEIS